MEAEELMVLYDYDYDYKERKISIRKDEKLKLLQRTNQHWWKVVRPGINKAFFVPAQYVQLASERTLRHPRILEGQESPSATLPQAQSPSPSSSPETESRTSSSSQLKPTHSSSKMKRGDSTRASKKALRLKNWSASLEELSKQIKFPGIGTESSESVMNLSGGGGGGEPSISIPPGGDTATTPTGEKKNKPVPLPRKSVSESSPPPPLPLGSRGVGETPLRESNPSLPPTTPKPIPKVRTSKWVTMLEDGSCGRQDWTSGGSSEVLTATSSEELLTPSSPGGRNNYKEESVLVTRSRFESSPEDRKEEGRNFRMKPKELHRSPPVAGGGGHHGSGPPNENKPRKPSVDDLPVRPLSENWSEYMTSEKRFYYYNSLTGATSWKPPRIHSSLHHAHHHGQGQGSMSERGESSSLENSHSSLILLDSSDFLLENNNHVSILREEEDYDENDPVPPNPRNGTVLPHLPVPQGWSYLYDGGVGQGFYVHDITGARWLSSQDPEGKIYYYEENSTKSSWFLPVPGISFIDDSSTPASKSTTSDSLERSREVSPRGHPGVMPDVVTTLPSPGTGSPAAVKKRHSAGEVADRLKTRSMLILPETRKLDVSKLGSLPRSGQTSIWSSSRDEESWIKVIREGPLSRTKITENEKKLRKNWSNSYVVLTEEHLSLFKDEKSFGSKKSELEIELGGSTVDWSVDKTSRKHVFQLNTSTDLQILFQADDAENGRTWIEDIQEVIKRQPVRELLRLRSTSPDPYMENPVVGEKKSSRLGRAKSTKLKITGSVENLTSEEKNKIRAQLKKFFNRRPARESLVKKGIYKDEAVFGCHLEKLCAREKKEVPNFVQQAILAIESKDENLRTDGIYRASGNLSQVQKIRLQVDQNNLNCLYQEEDVHVLAGALKLFFREMREPLIPTDLFSEALTAATNAHSKKEKIGKFRDIVGKLAKPNRATLSVLLKHLLRVSEYSEFNRMLIPNLAIVFGPTLMWPATESTNMALDLMQQNFVIEALLLDFDLIFDNKR